MKCDVLIAGVGGQGQVLASRLIGDAGMQADLQVRTSETIGMSQRGGCVTSSVRIGGEVMSSAVPSKGADLILGFELCETVRHLQRLAENGGVILNQQTIKPVSVSLGAQRYDEEKMLEFVKTKVKKLLVLDAMELAVAAGSSRAVNVVMLGAACGARFLPFEKDAMLSAITKRVPQKFREVNEKAFESGYNYAVSNLNK